MKVKLIKLAGGVLLFVAVCYGLYLYGWDLLIFVLEASHMGDTR